MKKIDEAFAVIVVGALSLMIAANLLIQNYQIDKINTILEDGVHTVVTGITVSDEMDVTENDVNLIVERIFWWSIWGGIADSVVYGCLWYAEKKHNCKVFRIIVDEVIDCLLGLIGILAIIGTYITLIDGATSLTIYSVQAAINVPILIFGMFCFNITIGRCIVRVLEALVPLDDIIDENGEPIDRKICVKFLFFITGLLVILIWLATP